MHRCECNKSKEGNEMNEAEEFRWKCTNVSAKSQKTKVLLHLVGFRPTVLCFGVKNVKIGNLGLLILKKCKNAPTHQVVAQSDEN